MQANVVMLKFITVFNLMNTSLPEIGTFRIYFSRITTVFQVVIV